MRRQQTFEQAFGFDERWLDHSSQCESCGWGRPQAIVRVVLAVRDGRQLRRELAVCAKCEQRLASETEAVVARR